MAELPALAARWRPVLLTVLIAVALRLYGLGEWSLWEDEETTIYFSYHTEKSFPRSFPTFFLLLGHTFRYTGCSVLVGRLLSAAIGVLSLFLIYGVARRFTSSDGPHGRCHQSRPSLLVTKHSVLRAGHLPADDCDLAVSGGHPTSTRLHHRLFPGGGRHCHDGSCLCSADRARLCCVSRVGGMAPRSHDEHSDSDRVSAGRNPRRGLSPSPDVFSNADIGHQLHARIRQESGACPRHGRVLLRTASDHACGAGRVATAHGAQR